jgi:transposase-like protein
MTINSRAKGASSELEFCKIVYQWAGIRLVRNLEQSRSGGHDLIVHSDEVGQVADSFRSLAIECKRYGTVTPGLIKTWWQQAREQAEHNRLHPVLAYRADRHDWQVIAPLHLINATMSRNLGLDSTCSMSVIGFCSVIRDGTLKT